MAIKQAKIKVVWKRGVFRELRTLDGVMDDLASRRQRIAAAAGPGYEASTPRVTGGRGRGRVTVKTATTSARRRESREHNLLRALNAGRG